MKFTLSISLSSHETIRDSRKVEALRRLGFDVEQWDWNGVSQERPSGNPVIEILNLDMLVQFTKGWGAIRMEGDTIFIIDRP